MRKHILVVLAIMLIAVAALGAWRLPSWGGGSTQASVTSHNHHRPPRPTPTPTPTPPSTPTPTPSPTSTANGNFTGPAAPSGWTVTYSRNFAAVPGLGDWVVQSGNNAPLIDSTKPGAEFGEGIETTAVSQWTELISSNAVVGPSSYVQGLVYIPAGSGGPNPYGNSFPAGSTANWPAFWTTGNPWPQNGEIDMLEGQNGRSCEQTHYGVIDPATNYSSDNSPSKCGSLGPVSTGWITVSMLRQNGEVQVWYNNAYIGEVPLPTTANEKLIWQNQSYSSSVCGNCFGPTLLGSASTAWLSNVRVYAP